MRNEQTETYTGTDAGHLIHAGFFRNAAAHPEKIAVVQRGADGALTRVSYGELADQALRWRTALAGVPQGSIVAAALDKSAEFIAAALGILAAGCAYLPVSSAVPAGRRQDICEQAAVQTVITERADAAFFAGLHLRVLTPEDAAAAVPAEGIAPCDPEGDAYVIFTSGTTGRPKGVEIQHFAAYNTLSEISGRFGVTAEDSIFAVSEIDFDLSVYDFFGMLAAGGTVIISDRGMKKEAAEWTALLKQANATVWNSVPMLLDMLLSADDRNEVVPQLRLILLSGDWVYPSLIQRIRERNQTARIIVLGGATEASVWSNCYEVGDALDSSFRAAPYGFPLRNQAYRIIGENGQPCGVMEEGELQIGGTGLARGYIGAPELTAERFIVSEGSRWYRTGDKGRYLPDGCIEFLGRLDNQVKFGGFRVELDEITKNLTAHPAVGGAASVMVQEQSKQYLASVVAERIPRVCAAAEKTGPVADQTAVRRQQTLLTDALLMQLLELDTALPTDEDTLFARLKFAPESRAVYDYWLSVLASDGCIVRRGGQVTEGPAMRQTAEKADAETVSQMQESISRMAAVMRGEQTAADLLADELLSPETVSMREPGILAGIAEIAERINAQYEDEEQHLRAAVIGVRTGMAAERIAALTADADIDFTFLDSTPYFTAQAKQRLGGQHSYRVMNDTVPDDLRCSFDLVLSVNHLHTNPDYEQGVFQVRELLRGGGKAYIVDLNELPPLSNLAAAQIEQGFSHFTGENRPQAHNPVMPGTQAAEAFCRMGFQAVRWHGFADSFFVFLEAERPDTAEYLTADALRYALGQHLPAYMIPEKIVFAPRIPMTKNGKPDHAALLAMVETEDTAEHLPLETETERRLAVMWQDILSTDSVGAEQSFFRSGGDSLLATHLLTRVRQEFHVEFSLKEMYSDPTLRAIAALIDEKAGGAADTDMEYGEI